jgi:hypothetical protein
VEVVWTPEEEEEEDPAAEEEEEDLAAKEEEEDPAAEVKRILHHQSGSGNMSLTPWEWTESCSGNLLDKWIKILTIKKS